MSPKPSLKALVVLLAGLSTLGALILAIGLAAGLVINWIFPSFGLGISAVLALTTLAIIGQLVAAFAGVSVICHEIAAAQSMVYSADDDEEQNYEPEVLNDDQVEFLADQVSEAFIARLLDMSNSTRRSPRPKQRSRR